MQEFFKTTLISKFIKYLLMVTPLPNVSFLNDYDIMVEGNFYLYRNKIYKCTRTGTFNGSNIIYKNYLYCSETVYCRDSLNCSDGLVDYGGNRLAEFEVISDYMEGQDIVGITELFTSPRSYYDSETHIKLGNYLRLLRSMYGLDLMSLYNCYCNYYVDNVDLSMGKLYEYNNPKYKVTLIPVKFNKTYTISLNASSTVFIKPIIYNKKLLRTRDRKKFIYDNKYTGITTLSSNDLTHPFKLSIYNTDSEAQSLENYLYLAIQLPASNNSPITVLEGDFNNYIKDVTYDSRIFKYATESDINKTFVSKPSLLSNSIINSLKNNIPFSDRLIEYLVGHTIDMRDEISENVIRAANDFGYPSNSLVVWDNEFRSKLFTAYMKVKDKNPYLLNYEDILGYVDKDMEMAINRGYINYGS